MKTGVKYSLLAIAGVFLLVCLFNLCDGKEAKGNALPNVPHLYLDSIDCWHDTKTFRCVKYLRNYDGDTISFDIPYIPPVFGKDISIRLLGVDAPEIKTSSSCEKKLALEAKLAVKEMLTQGKEIELHEVGRDKYFRLDANVIVDGKSVSEMLLKKGLAYPYSGGHKPDVDWCHFSLKERGL